MWWRSRLHVFSWQVATTAADALLLRRYGKDGRPAFIHEARHRALTATVGARRVTLVLVFLYIRSQVGYVSDRNRLLTFLQDLWLARAKLIVMVRSSSGGGGGHFARWRCGWVALLLLMPGGFNLAFASHLINKTLSKLINN